MASVLEDRPDRAPREASQESSSTLKALSVLEALVRSPRPPTLTQLMQETGLPKPTLYRTLALFEEAGYVQREPAGRAYAVGPRLAGLGLAILARSAICRIPATRNPKAKRVEFRAPDPTCNPYLAFSAILMAGLDGICNQIDPGEAKDVDLYQLPAEEKKKIKQVPSSLTEVLDALEADHDFLLEGGVFTSDLLEEYIKYKRVHEVDAVRLRPTPHEYVLYFDC